VHPPPRQSTLPPQGGCLYAASRKGARGRRACQQAQQAGGFGLGASMRCYWIARFLAGLTLIAWRTWACRALAWAWAFAFGAQHVSAHGGGVRTQHARSHAQTWAQWPTRLAPRLRDRRVKRGRRDGWHPTGILWFARRWLVARWQQFTTYFIAACAMVYWATA
jgi:hypothetical protein